MLIPIHEVKLCGHCYTWSEALCSLLYMECRLDVCDKGVCAVGGCVHAVRNCNWQVVCSGV